MPRSRSYSRSSSRSRDYPKKSKKKSISREKNRDEDRYRSSRSHKSSSRYKSPTRSSRRRSTSRRRSRSRSSERYKSSKTKYYKKRSESRSRDYGSYKKKSRSNEKDRYKKSASRSSSSASSSESESSSSSATGSSTKSEIKSDPIKEFSKSCQVTNKNELDSNSKLPDKIKISQTTTISKTEVTFSSVDLLDNQVKYEVLEQINANEFAPKQFISSTKKIPENIKIDLTSDTISIPKVEDEKSKKPDDSIFHPNLYGDDSVRMEKWIRKFFLYRQKMFSEM